MYQIKTLNKIAKIGLNNLDNTIFAIDDSFENPDGVLVRSASMHETELGSNLKAIARAGAGVNNIPVSKCSEQGIVVFNTPGANANAVKELVISSLFLSSRKITEGIEWAKTLKGSGAEVPKLVEKGKGAFAGPEIEGKTLGVIGLGAIGVMVSNAAYYLGMNVIGFDPYISVDAAWGLSRHVKKAKSLEEIYKNADYITIHVPLTDETKGMINSSVLSTVKKGIRVLNFSRGELVNTADIKVALEDGTVSCYVTDFPSEEVLLLPNTIAIPHLGASTPESEDNCAVMAAKEISDFLLTGSITNSVNFPNVSLPRTSDQPRVCVIHRNIPKMLGQISATLGEINVNIENMINRSKGDYAYTIIDIKDCLMDTVISDLQAIEGVIKVRTIV